MEIKNDLNYAVIANRIDQKLLNNFLDYTIIDDKINYADLTEMIYLFPSKTIVFNDCLRQFTNKEKDQIWQLLKKRQVNYVNITSNMEEVIKSDYLYVFYDDKLAMEGPTLDLLKEEKLLKRLGFGLPFTVDLSMQLKLYGLLSDTETDLEMLVNKLWN